ncbi:4-galactosyl-N-acetylglucosaminide 3-alpha-L-fucosyltransferase FUT6-like [Pelobates fuscus]|uniref:4-galactosyl-N-acetylglucosaminide 3-alpha-L-fucosyltransferase FUT6-like n=1 Tax=Pelobates fuscus TaxID=191477 RepID=UPI002FE45B14
MMAFSGQKLSRKNIALVIFIQICLAVLLVTVYQMSNTQKEWISNQLDKTQFEHSKVILLWTYPFGQKFKLNECPPHLDQSGCFFTDNRELYSLANVVIFHHKDVSRTKTQLPQGPRHIYQYWIWFNMESPSHTRNLHFMENKFNFTMSYRADSDIFTPYGYLENKKSDQNFTIPTKTNLVAWIVSNWYPTSKRIQYYKELKQYVTIDIYGKRHLPLSSDIQVDTLSKYKFYLSFENSAHEDYITEKLWYNALTSGTVPIVMGPSRKNYERFIPSHSFIHVDDFPSAQELAAYLLELDKDDQKYQQYFNWRAMYQSSGQFDWEHIYCKVCKALEAAPVYRTRPSIEKWFR